MDEHSLPELVGASATCTLLRRQLACARRAGHLPDHVDLDLQPACNGTVDRVRAAGGMATHTPGDRLVLTVPGLRRPGARRASGRKCRDPRPRQRCARSAGLLARGEGRCRRALGSGALRPRDGGGLISYDAALLAVGTAMTVIMVATALGTAMLVTALCIEHAMRPGREGLAQLASALRALGQRPHVVLTGLILVASPALFWMLPVIGPTSVLFTPALAGIAAHVCSRAFDPSGPHAPKELRR